MASVKLKFFVVCVVVGLLGAAPVALADWDEGDGHKMHYPQLPKLGGWDVAFPARMADDWECSETSPVTDIHFWVSWNYDDVQPINGFSVRIWSDDPCGPGGYSEPNELLWESEFYAGDFTVLDMPPDLQSWFEPWSGGYVLNDHISWQQINIVDINEPFPQKMGTIYWLEIDMWGATGIGWKESGSPHFRDDAVYWYSSKWNEVRDPFMGETMDLAFVITGEGEEPEPGIKWVQYPDLDWTGMDVDVTYCGPGGDDFECTTTGPITDFHIWGSWYLDQLPFWWDPGIMGDPTAVQFWVSIWSDDPCGPDGYSQPNELLYEWWFDPGQFDVSVYAEDLNEWYYVPCEFVGADQDWTCWQYNFYMDPCETFIQEGSPDEPVTYWVVVQAFPIDPMGDVYFGWKTSLDHWKDDGVWGFSDMPGGPEPNPYIEWNELLYPLEHPYYPESIDLAFVITGEEEPTDPNIKWSQPPVLYEPPDTYIGWDEPSLEPWWVMALDDFRCDSNDPVTAIRWWGSLLGYYDDYIPYGLLPDAFYISIWTDTPAVEPCEPEVKWTQWPDLSEFGFDLDVTEEGEPWYWAGPEIAADDFPCYMTGPITDIHIWGSWVWDSLPEGDPTNVWFTLSIHANNPQGPSGYSEPCEPPLWIRDFYYPDFDVSLYSQGLEGYWIPCEGIYEYDTICWQYDFYIDPEDAFVQQEGEIYWLNVQAHVVANEDDPVRFGWKTSIDQWNDYAVWACGYKYDHGQWMMLEHPMEPMPVDLAFMITTTPEGYSHPNEVIWETYCDTYDVNFYGWEYDPQIGTITLPKFEFYQEIDPCEYWYQPDDSGIYWLGIMALYDTQEPNYPFGWETRPHFFMDDAVRFYYDMFPPRPDTQYPPEFFEPIEWDGETWDLSFELISKEEPCEPPELDFGDANDPPYPTLLPNGARHVIAGPWLGPADDGPDPEPDGQPDATATGDDNDGNDDEDGVTIPTLTQGIPATITVEVSPVGLGGFVELWVDFNGNNNWTDAGELVFSGMLGSGLNLIPVTAPFGSVVGQTFARCRISSMGTGSTTGLAPDGEVEDHEVTIQQGRDFGDAPSPYPTVGPPAAKHIIVPGVMLGASIDAEPTGQPNATATGDDNDGNDDEDGVVFTSPLVAGQAATVDVTASVPGMLNAWLDFNANNNWGDAGEQIFTNVALTGGGMTDTLNFNVPAAAAIGSTFARFRFDTTGGLSYTGQAADGEVEDYMVDIEEGEEVLYKWSQPPVEIDPGMFFGWDELSIYGWTQIVADDWPCNDQRPVTDVHWWGSYYEWTEPMPPPFPLIGFHIGIWTDVPPGIDQPWSHPGIMIWEYRANIAEVYEEFVGVDFHPEHPLDSCFKYTLQLPEEMWFWQDPNENAIYWISIAAIYEVQPPEMWYWGWKTREHYFMDDAVRILFPTAPEPGEPFIEGEPIEDPPGVSWDMAFELTTQECLIGGNAHAGEYIDWAAWGYPKCWCYEYQCRGDINGKKTMLWRVQALDLDIFRAAFFKTDPQLATVNVYGEPGVCADLNHKKTMLWRVQALDLIIFRTYFFVMDPGVPPCDQVPIITGPYNFWTTP